MNPRLHLLLLKAVLFQEELKDLKSWMEFVEDFPTTKIGIHFSNVNKSTKYRKKYLVLNILKIGLSLCWWCFEGIKCSFLNTLLLRLCRMAPCTLTPLGGGQSRHVQKNIYSEPLPCVR